MPPKYFWQVDPEELGVHVWQPCKYASPTIGPFFRDAPRPQLARSTIASKQPATMVGLILPAPCPTLPQQFSQLFQRVGINKQLQLTKSSESGIKRPNVYPFSSNKFQPIFLSFYSFLFLSLPLSISLFVFHGYSRMNRFYRCRAEVSELTRRKPLFCRHTGYCYRTPIHLQVWESKKPSFDMNPSGYSQI